MSMIGGTGLEVGKWIYFSISMDLSSSTPEKQAIYEESQRFLVISREDALFDD